MRRFALTALAILLTAVPAASAQDTNAPPGNSGVDQYLESVPSGSGNTSSNGVAAAKPTPASKQVARALRSRGSAGAQLERLVASTSPTKPNQRGSSKGSGGATENSGGVSGQPADKLSSAGDSSAVKATAAAATGSGGGMGLWLAVLLGIVALAALVGVGARLARRRA